MLNSYRAIWSFTICYVTYHLTIIWHRCQALCPNVNPSPRRGASACAVRPPEVTGPFLAVQKSFRHFAKTEWGDDSQEWTYYLTGFYTVTTVNIIYWHYQSNIDQTFKFDFDSAVEHWDFSSTERLYFRSMRIIFRNPSLSPRGSCMACHVTGKIDMLGTIERLSRWLVKPVWCLCHGSPRCISYFLLRACKRH